MHQQVALGALAIAIGVVAGVVLFVPFVALSYRRRGGLSFGRLVLWAAALVYFWAIWTYTLLPLPDPEAIRCAGVNLDLLKLVDDVRGAVARPGRTLTDPAVLQLVLNVLLFVPLGFFVRVLGGRGILVAFCAGLGTSLLVETTQLTGVWGIYPCAYRVFDVDDLVTNTAGALVGSVAGLVVPRRHRGMARTADAGAPRPVTRRRRALAMACDALGALLVQAGAGVAVQVGLQLSGHRAAVLSGEIASVTGTVVPAAVWLVVVLATGRTVGDLAVELRYAGGRLPEPVARLLRYLGGIGGYLLLGLLPGGWAALQWVFVALSVVLLLATARGRGLPGLLSGRHVSDARGEPVRPSVPAPAPR